MHKISFLTMFYIVQNQFSKIFNIIGEEDLMKIVCPNFNVLNWQIFYLSTAIFAMIFTWSLLALSISSLKSSTTVTIIATNAPIEATKKHIEIRIYGTSQRLLFINIP